MRRLSSRVADIPAKGRGAVGVEVLLGLGDRSIGIWTFCNDVKKGAICD